MFIQFTYWGFLFYLVTHIRGTMAIVNDELHMSIHMFIVAFDAVAIRFWEGSYFTVFDFESAWLMIVAVFHQRGEFWKPEGPIAVGCLGKEKDKKWWLAVFAVLPWTAICPSQPFYVLTSSLTSPMLQYFLYFLFIHLTVLAQSFLVLYSVFRNVCDL